MPTDCSNMCGTYVLFFVQLSLENSLFPARIAKLNFTRQASIFFKIFAFTGFSPPEFPLQY